jgi:hypothetical protein
VAAVLAALAIPLALRQGERTDARFGDLRAAESDALADAIDAAGGGDVVAGCPGPIRVDDGYQFARLVYELDVPPDRLRLLTLLAAPAADGEPQVIFARGGGLNRRQLDREMTAPVQGIERLAANDHWSIYAVSCP